MARVLLVDDSQTVREAIAIVLRLDRHEVTCIGGGVDALKLLATTSFDIVLFDLAMPHMDGLEFLCALRGTPAGKAMPVILLTGAGHPDKIRRCQELGVVACLVKGTFAIKELSVMIQSAVAAPPAVPPGSEGRWRACQAR